MKALWLLSLTVTLCTLEGGARAETAEQVAPGCFRKDHKVTCRSWNREDAPDIPATFYRNVLVLDLSAMDAAKKLDMMGRTDPCDKQRVLELPAQGLGAALPGGRLPARWFNGNYATLYVLYIRGAGLRHVHENAFEMLSALQVIYLSSNLLQRLPPDLWHHNTHLTGVSLENNVALVIPENEPLFRSDSVENLDLAGCGLRSLPAEAFAAMPRLQTLRLERNCLSTVPVAALSNVEDLWSTTLADNAIAELSAVEAGLVARLPDATLHGNPWRCDCALRDAMRAQEGDALTFWKQSIVDLVCRWPPEDMEKPWLEVLTRKDCRVYNETLDNATSSAPARPRLPTLAPPASSAEPQAEASRHGACAHCDSGGNASYCKWTAIVALVLLLIGVFTLVLATFTDRLAFTVSVAGAHRKTQHSLSQANLTESANDNGVYLHDEISELSPNEADDRRHFVVRFGRRT